MQKLKQIPKRVHHFLIGLVLTAVLGVLAFAVVNTYTAYTDMVVQQQQQYLLVTARAVSKTLSLYISGQLRDIEILTRSPGFLTEFENYYETGGDTALREHIVSYMLSQKRGVKRIYLLEKSCYRCPHCGNKLDMKYPLFKGSCCPACKAELRPAAEKNAAK